MPKHKIFIQDYGRSSKYAVKKRATQECMIEISSGSEDEDNTPSFNDGSSSIGRVSSSSNNPISDVNIDDPGDEEDDSIHGEDPFTASEAASDDGQVNSDIDIEFDDGDSDGENNHEAYAEAPLYAGAPLTLGESMTAILTFMICHNLTGSALCNLLTLISLHCQQPNLLKTTLYYFRKYFGGVHYRIVKHYFCALCFSRLNTTDSICDTCPVPNGVSYFIEIPILNQLQVLFKRRGFYDKLRHKFNRQKINDANLEDIYDGNVYRELSGPNGILSHPNNISFTWNTDGVSIFGSSGYQIWPFYLIINELPYAERSKSENMLLAGLWFGPQKPDPNLFLKPIHSALSQIYEGVYLNVPRKDAPIKVRGVVICGTCDLPAKSAFFNMTQFNGKYGCPKCKLKGQSVERVWTYPFRENLDLRTDEEMHGFAKEAVRIKEPVFGVKGPSELNSFIHKPVRTTAVDSMHCIFAGVTKKLCKIFVDPDYSDHPASLRQYIDLIDSRLRALAPPSFLQRRPRSVKEFKYWKANELKAWLFYYSLVILCDIMPTEYFEHYSMLVIGVFALHQASISSETLEYASRLLREFVNRYDVLYGARHMTCNVHLLLHIPETVRDFGPLFITSCFPFEDFNGKLKRLVHSSRHPELQICSAVSNLINLSTLRHENLEYGSAAYDYCSKVSNPNRKMRLGNLMDGISSVGLCRETSILPVIVTEALARADIVGRKFATFSRLRKNGTLYTAQSYTRSIKYDNTCVQYNHNDSKVIGIIHSFVKVHNCECHYENMCECYATSYAIIRPCILSSILARQLLRHVPEVVLECTGMLDQAIAVHVDQLGTVCFMLNIADTGKSYVALPANSIEVE